jgi:lysozyme family protein
VTRFDACLSVVLNHEGGVVNHAADPGGLTNAGVTQATWNAYRDRIGLPRMPVTSMSPDDRRDLYFRAYWLPNRCDELPEPFDLIFFDSCVLLATPVELLQAVLGVVVDGDFGPITLNAALTAPTYALCEEFLFARIGFHCGATSIRQRNEAFLRGWLARCRNLFDYVPDADVVEA